MVRKALDGKVGGSAEEKEGFVQEFTKLRAVSEEQYYTLVQDNVTLKKVL